MKLRGFEVYIKCDGRRLDEYATGKEDGVISCYVSSEAGKEFEIRGANLSSTGMSAGISVDGRAFPTRICFEPCFKPGASGMIPYYAGNGRRQLVFSEVRITDDENVASSLGELSQLGLIQVRISRALISRKQPRKPLTDTGTVSTSLGPFHEKSKKGGLHCVELGATEALPERAGYTSQYIDDLSSPYVTFNFRYRPRAILQAQGIIELDEAEPPRSDTSMDLPNTQSASTPGVDVESRVTLTRKRREERNPSDGPQKRPRTDKAVSSAIPLLDASMAEGHLHAEEVKPLVLKDEDDDDEAAEFNILRTQMRSLQEQLDRMEKRRTQARRLNTVKREPSPVRVGAFNGGVIDLTDD
ncbi:uncharacterized protein C8Q71DRAFT_194681 [Rhodofomes roseus]|uniref:DUF7918 domain-containing protein n=1 Tax=Rhodofomes roseus TaxID=34475 RepID=A0ABQ8K7S1_9APHY|nr:uncharacterized protein C8Q71DRAFT_194681 [Rhodofomes roseus]KAH9833222.1 hypothetical protein C8Q71DRAFT_194681 [Rhodofomes roseus]